jgi:two-component system, NarL family, nitrate/nitrite response regulator NarL
MSISVFAFESQPIAVRGLRALADDENGIFFSGAAASSTEALDRMREVPSDVVLVDQSAGLRTAMQFVSDLRQISPSSNAILWVHEQSEIDGFRAIQMGVRAVLRKTVALDTLLECVRTVASGNIWMEQSTEPSSHAGLRPAPKLTPREREIAGCVCKGMRNREIAERLTITPGTVKVHLMHIFEKTGVKDRFELAIHGRRLMGLDGPEGAASIAVDLETTRVA